MTTEVQVLARIRKLLESFDTEAPGGYSALTLTQQLELLQAQGAAPYQEIVRNGRALWTGTTAALAAVVARPTTAVMLALHNLDPDSGRTIIIDWVAALNVVSTAVVCQAQLLIMNGQLDETTPLADAAFAQNKCNGNGGQASDSPARTSIAALPATTGIATNWAPLGQSVTKPSAVATPGYGLFERVDGRFLVPPGRIFAMHVQANVVGETFLGFIGYHHKQLVLG